MNKIILNIFFVLKYADKNKHMLTVIAFKTTMGPVE